MDGKPSLLTSREEPVGVLDDGLDDANDLQGNRRHHLCDVAAARATERTERVIERDGQSKWPAGS